MKEINEVMLSWRYYGDAIDALYSQMVEGILDADVTPRIIARSSTQKSFIANYLAASGIPTRDIEWSIYELDSAWIRDYGPFPLFDELGNAVWSDAGGRRRQRA